MQMALSLNKLYQFSLIFNFFLFDRERKDFIKNSSRIAASFHPVFTCFVAFICRESTYLDVSKKCFRELSSAKSVYTHSA